MNAPSGKWLQKWPGCLFSWLYSTQAAPTGWFPVAPLISQAAATAATLPVGAPAQYTCGGSLSNLHSSAPPTPLAQAHQSLHLHHSVPLQHVTYQQTPLQQVPQPRMQTPIQPQSPTHGQPQVQASPASVVAPRLPAGGAVSPTDGTSASADAAAAAAGTFCSPPSSTSSNSSSTCSTAALPSSAKIQPAPPTSTLPLGHKWNGGSVWAECENVQQVANAKMLIPTRETFFFSFFFEVVRSCVCLWKLWQMWRRGF